MWRYCFPSCTLYNTRLTVRLTFKAKCLESIPRLLLCGLVLLDYKKMLFDLSVVV